MNACSFCTRRPSPVRLAAGLLLSVLLIPSGLCAQVTRSWAVQYQRLNAPGAGCSSSFLNSGGATARARNALAADAAGNAYFTGATSSGDTMDVLTVKYDSQGVVQWAVQYDGGSADCGNAVAVDAS